MKTKRFEKTNFVVISFVLKDLKGFYNDYRWVTKYYEENHKGLFWAFGSKCFRSDLCKTYVNIRSGNFIPEIFFKT